VTRPNDVLRLNRGCHRRLSYVAIQSTVRDVHAFRPIVEGLAIFTRRHLTLLQVRSGGERLLFMSELLDDLCEVADLLGLDILGR